jgi:aminopeptidase N
MVPLLLLLLAADPAPLDASTRDFDQVHLSVRVTPRIAEGIVDGETTLDFLSLADPLKVLRLHCEETAVHSVRDGAGAPLEHSLAGGVLSIPLAAPLARGAAGRVTVAYRARPTQGMFFHAPTPESPSTPLEMYSQGEGTDNRRWFPCYDLPDDRATVEVFAAVPEDMTTVSNGTRVGSAPRPGGLREDHWRLDRTIPTYLVSLIAGRFDSGTAKAGDVTLEFNAQKGRLQELRNGCANTPSMMAFFADYTGHPYPYPRYAQTTVWDFVYGGMENASATTMNMRLLHPEDALPNYSGDGLVAHELAHQWFGDLLTCRTFEHIWLNEGFATYFTDLWFESHEGPEKFTLERRSQNRRYMDQTREPEKLGLKPSPRGDVPLELFGGKQYNRGAAILHQLRIELGDAAFRDGIRAWVKGNVDRAVTSEEFRRAMEGAAGRDLRWFFDQWVYGAGYPVLEVTMKPRSIVVEQVQVEGGGQPAEFRITVPVRVGEERVRLDVRRRRQEFEVPLAKGPVRIGEGGGTFARIRVKQESVSWMIALMQEPDVSGRMDAAEALLEWPDFADDPLAEALGKDACWAVRQECARSLGRIPGPVSLAGLLAAVADPDARVREAVAESLGARERSEVAAALGKMLAEDKSPYVRSMAARSLGKVHAEGAFDLLAALLKVDSHRETLRQGALDGLAAFGDPRALDLARPLLRYDWPRGDNFPLREAALRVLLALAPDAPQTRAAVVTLLSDPFHRMRERAAETAGNFAIREAVPILAKMAESEPFDGVQRAAKAALEKVAPKKQEAR